MNRMEKNKLTTAEIKGFIMECVRDGETYSVREIKDYISQKTDKVYTPGQISGALMQLTTAEKLRSMGRGLYAAGRDRTENDGKILEEQEELSEKQIEFRRQIKECMQSTASQLQKIVSQVDMWELTESEFAFLGEIRKLNEQMKKIEARCWYNE